MREVLRLDLADVGIGEGLRPAAQRVGGSNMLGYNDICVLHHAVLTREGRNDVLVELQGQQHDDHAQEVGEEEACELTEAQMASKEFPDEFHSLKTFS